MQLHAIKCSSKPCNVTGESQVIDTHVVAYETLITVRQEDTGNIRMSWQPQVRLMTNFSNNAELSPTPTVLPNTFFH